MNYSFFSTVFIKYGPNNRGIPYGKAPTFFQAFGERFKMINLTGIEPKCYTLLHEKLSKRFSDSLDYYFNNNNWRYIFVHEPEL